MIIRAIPPDRNGNGPYATWSESPPYEQTDSRFSWVRAWTLFRLAIIAQGIAARAALGQASSADAKADSRVVFDFFGKMAWQIQTETGQALAKL